MLRDMLLAGILLLASAGLASSADKLISPWTSPRVRGSAVSCWGREYKFGTSVLPSKIVTQKDDILSGPIEIVAVIGGHKVKWDKTEFKALGGDRECVWYATSASSIKLSVECKFVTEFDGMTRVDMKVKPKGTVKLDSLDIIVPLKAKYAKLFHHYPDMQVFEWDWPKKRMNSGSVPASGMALPFVFAIWLGNDDRGIQFFSESDESWSPKDHDKAVTVSPSGKSTVLRFNALADYELPREWKWTFGFVATPVKPFMQEHYKIHYCQSGTYGLEKSPGLGQPSQLDAVVKKMLVNYMGYHENWSDEQSLPRPKNPEDLRSLIKGCHDLGIGLVLYTGSWMPQRSAEYQKKWKSKPIDEFMVYERGDNHDKCNYMCPNTGFPDLQVKLFDEAFKEYGFDGLYLDGPAASLPCNNMEHGCGYIGKDGKPHQTMPIWKPRETMKRLWRMVKSQPRPCIIVGHSSGSLTLPILSFVDKYLDGEHLLGWRKIGTDEYPEDILRAEMSGHNFGIPALQLPLRDRTDAEQERARTICLLYDALMEWNPMSTWDIWRAYDSFGMDKVKWIPFWRTDGLASCGDSDVRVSAYLDKGRGALFVVANLGAEDAVTEIVAKRKGLGLKAGCGLHARDEAEGTDIEMSDDKAALTIKPGTFRLISIQALKASNQ